jgi:hypothetical protein
MFNKFVSTTFLTHLIFSCRQQQICRQLFSWSVESWTGPYTTSYLNAYGTMEIASLL